MRDSVFRPCCRSLDEGGEAGPPPFALPTDPTLCEGGAVDWHWDNTFVRELGWLGVRIDPAPVAEPTLLALDDELASAHHAGRALGERRGRRRGGGRRGGGR